MPEDFDKKWRGMVKDSAKQVFHETVTEAPGAFVSDMKKAGRAIGRGAKAATDGVRKLGGYVRERLFNSMK